MHQETFEQLTKIVEHINQLLNDHKLTKTVLINTESALQKLKQNNDIGKLGRLNIGGEEFYVENALELTKKDLAKTCLDMILPRYEAMKRQHERKINVESLIYFLAATTSDKINTKELYEAFSVSNEELLMKIQQNQTRI